VIVPGLCPLPWGRDYRGCSDWRGVFLFSLFFFNEPVSSGLCFRLPETLPKPKAPPDMQIGLCDARA